MFTKEMMQDYADKLLIGLSDEEINDLLEEFDVIKENMDMINDIKGLKEIPIQNYPTDYIVDDLRDDIIEDSLEVNDALKNCDDVIDKVVIVPKVVG